MPYLSWCANRSGGISLLLVLALCFWVLFKEALDATTPLHHDSGHHMQMRVHDLATSHGDIFVYIFAYYSIIVQAFVVAFQFRACRAIWEGTANLRKTILQKRPEYQNSHPRWKISSSPSSADVSSSSSSISSSEFGDLDSSTEIEDDLELVVHAILIPNYEEDIEGLTETLQVLASHPQASQVYDVSGGIDQVMFCYEFPMLTRTIDISRYGTARDHSED
jgi:hypothetical protein